MKVLVIDDEFIFLKVFSKKLEKILGFDYHNLTIDSTNPEDIDLEKISSYDLIFLDIVLGNYNGIDLAKKIRNINITCTLVFISSKISFIFKAIEIQPFYFIRKSSLDDDLLVFSTLFKEHMKKAHKPLIIHNNGRIIPIRVNKIIFIESMGHDLIVHTDYNVEVYRESIKNFKREFIECKNFIQTHKSFIVNMNRIQEVILEEIILDTKDIIPIGGKYKNKFIENYMEFLSS